MSLHNELQSFLLTLPAVTDPVVNSFVDPPTPTDDVVKQRIVYGTNVQGSLLPYFAFDGPHNTKINQVSGGKCSLQESQWWLSAFTPEADEALDWLIAIQNALSSLFTVGYFYKTPLGRISSMLYVEQSLAVVGKEQIARTADEFPNAGATMLYTIAYHADS